MGDRTTVNLTVLLEQFEAVKEICERGQEYFSEESDDGKHAVLTFYDVNYGNLSVLQSLREAGIAYTSEWDSGCEYDSGGDYCRFSEEGTLLTSEIYDGDRSIPIIYLMGLLDKPQELVRFIQDANQKLQILPLDKNQIQYGKRYLARKLIGATDS